MTCYKTYISRNVRKYGIKILKVYCEIAYNWHLKMYTRQKNYRGCSVLTNVVFTLSNNLLNSVRSIVVDNCYTNIEPTNILVDKKTHLYGTLWSNSRENPRNHPKKIMER